MQQRTSWQRCHSGGRDATADEVMRSRCRIRGLGLGSMPLQPEQSAEQKYYLVSSIVSELLYGSGTRYGMADPYSNSGTSMYSTIEFKIRNSWAFKKEIKKTETDFVTADCGKKKLLICGQLGIPGAVLWIRIHWVRIWIQHFKWIRIQDFDDLKLRTKIHLN
jgi:hypothetical protein